MRGLLKFLLSLMVLFALPLSSAIAASAYVHDLKGTLTASVGNGPARPLKMGDTFDAGVTLATSKDSIAVVKFEDGQVVTLSSDTRFAVQEYNYNKRSVKDSNMVFALLQGGLRFVTGVIGSTNNNKFKLAVGTATIGVRGTDGWASYVEGVILAAVNQGALAFTTPQGTQAIPVGSTAVTGAGITTTVVAPTAQLAQTLRAQGTTVGAAVANVVQSRSAVQSQINNVTIPINTPVVVAAAAQAAQVVGTARVAQALAAAAANNLAAAKTDAEKAAATAAKQAADAAAAKATALATAAIATAQQAAVQALDAARTGGAVPSTPPPPAPAATPLTAVVPALTTAQVQQQAATVNASVVTQTTQLQTTQTTLGLPVTSTSTIQNAAPTTEAAPALPGTTIPIYVPPPAPTTPVSPS